MSVDRPRRWLCRRLSCGDRRRGRWRAPQDDRPGRGCGAVSRARRWPCHRRLLPSALRAGLRSPARRDTGCERPVDAVVRTGRHAYRARPVRAAHACAGVRTMTALLRGDGRALIVAEIGNNHEGDPSVALDLVHRAAECGVDAVKFQTFRTEQFVRPADAARFARLKRFELSPDDFVRLADAARRNGLLFISTPLDLDSARMLEPLVDAFKIASGDITCTPLIECVGQSGKPVFLSSGASDAGEVEQAVAVLRRCWARSGSTPELAVLHCVSCY